MAYYWFRIEHDCIDKPKFLGLSRLEFYVLHGLKCLVSQQRPRRNDGRLVEPDGTGWVRDDLAQRLHIRPDEDLSGALAGLEKRKLITIECEVDGPMVVEIVGWVKEQYPYPSDEPSKTRKRKHKSRSKKMIPPDPTLPLNDVTTCHDLSRALHERVTRQIQRSDTDPDTEGGNSAPPKQAVENSTDSTSSETDEVLETVLESYRAEYRRWMPKAGEPEIDDDDKMAVQRLVAEHGVARVSSYARLQFEASKKDPFIRDRYAFRLKYLSKIWHQCAVVEALNEAR